MIRDGIRPYRCTAGAVLRGWRVFPLELDSLKNVQYLIVEQKMPIDAATTSRKLLRSTHGTELPSLLPEAPVFYRCVHAALIARFS